MEEAIFNALLAINIANSAIRYFNKEEPSGDENFDNLQARMHAALISCIDDMHRYRRHPLREELRQCLNRGSRYLNRVDTEIDNCRKNTDEFVLRLNAFLEAASCAIQDAIYYVRKVEFINLKKWEELDQAVSCMNESIASCFEIENDVTQDGMDIYISYLAAIKDFSGKNKKRKKFKK